MKNNGRKTHVRPLVFVEAREFLEALVDFCRGELSAQVRLSEKVSIGMRIAVNTAGMVDLIFAISELGGGRDLVMINASDENDILTIEIRTESYEPTVEELGIVVRAARYTGFSVMMSDDAILLKTRKYGKRNLTVYSSTLANRWLKWEIFDRVARCKENRPEKEKRPSRFE